ncbi:MAG: GTP-binding protein, partial [Candidatus Brocadiia bacterium]|nr:GTP-binding protein [Candidatus Brocadiia bacterium]
GKDAHRCPAPPARAAIITPPGEGGIGIIALAGPAAAEVLGAVFAGTHRGAAEIAPGSIAHGRVVRGGATLDEVIVARLGEPCAAGDEAVFEINCHGGVQAVQAVLRCLGEAGAAVVRAEGLQGGPADTCRPLSRGAVRAAALSLLPRAQTRLGARMLLGQAGGALSGELSGVSEDLAAGPGAAPGAEECLAAVLATAPLARALLEPPRVLLAGPPNVGKSTLMNALLRRERVIVHHRPGTTRDAVREVVSVRGLPLEIIDTAGIRAAAGEVEREAVRRAAALLQTCDVALVLFDARSGPGWAAEHEQELRGVPRLVLVGNKIDLLREEPAVARRPDSPRLPAEFGDVPEVFIAASEGRGIERVESVLLAPYEGAMRAVERGAPAAFTAGIAAALERVRSALREGGPARALEELERSC